ncbi:MULTISPECIES: hypothetical protein [Erysipelotrichaceae]|uniref:Uncharacterized protein n=1 Tax=Stecheria intestinalis TaxID=2606630 RepID=A0A7X2NQ85_9FIRM|nr:MULTISPECIES: hypothetical protein [Erysipelotrichaceae]MDD5880770.1 hypothetical protein [Stecheria intestinalis]MDD6370240.1 hypothetical protein [Galactobacillus timonensis]MDD7681110.1 hypothetical protein [Stecheria intestinalis]MSS57403.1 hypothetical protein [Stecheria intestinalis]
MLKKLQNLLFEEEDDDLEEDEEEEAVEEAPVRRKHRKAAPEPEEEETISEPARPQVKPLQTATTMNRIDVTQPLPKQSEPEKNQEVFRRPAAVQHASPRPLEADPEILHETAKPKTTLGITVDDEPKKPEPAPVRPSRPQPAVKPSKPAKPAKAAPVYEFQPVISPMFGVDEKDMDAMQTTAKEFRTGLDDDNNVSKIISPIYGISKEAEPTTIQKTVEKSNEMENLTYTKEARKAEDSIPEFSLDDILNGHDEEFARQSAAAAADDSYEDVDETVVMDTKNITPFGKVNAPKKDAGTR